MAADQPARQVEPIKTASYQPPLSSTKPLYGIVSKLNLPVPKKPVDDEFAISGVYLD